MPNAFPVRFLQARGGGSWAKLKGAKQRSMNAPKDGVFSIFLLVM